MKLKKILSVILCISLLLSIAASAVGGNIVDGGNCGDYITWELDNEGILTISGTGNMTYDYASPWEGNTSIKSVIIEDGVTSIGRDAFSGCSSLVSITIPDSVTKIGEYAFAGCSSLTSITIPDSVTMIGSYIFNGCSSLVSITIPDSVTIMGDCVFNGCSSLTSVVIGDGVTYIGSYAFDGCSSLENIYYRGMAAEWENIESGLYNDSLSDANIIFDCDIIAIGTCGENLTWALDDEGILTISGTGNMVTGNKDNDYASPWEDNDSIKSVIIEDGVTNISIAAFAGCKSLMTVTIPDSVTRIGEYAFAGCSSLTSITIPDSVTYICYRSFMDCSNLTSITIPDSVTSIDFYAFSGCSSLVSIVIPDSVTVIGAYAFNGCSSLTSVVMGNGVTCIYDHVFDSCSSLKNVYYKGTAAEWENIEIGLYNDSLSDANIIYDCDIIVAGTCGENLTWALDDEGILTISGNGDMQNYYLEKTPWSSYYDYIKKVIIEDGVTSIGDRAFSFLDLTSIAIPDSVTSIGYDAFTGCSNLTSIAIPDSVISIGEGAFYSCSSLTSITIPDSVISIGEVAFSRCSSLVSVTIPSSTTSIGDLTFRDCSSLTSITVDKDNQYYSNDEYGVLFNKDKTELICYPMGNERTSYNIPDGVTSIYSYAFSYCPSLESITIPDSVTIIGTYAFIRCPNLTSVVMGNGVTYIGSYAFDACSSLENVYYKGTEAEWENIEIGLYNDSPLSEVNIIYLSDIKIPELTSASIKLYSGITLIFKADASQFAEDYAPYVVVTLNGAETVIRDYTVIDGKYVFEFENISAHMMNDTVTAVLYSTIGGSVFESEPIEYSIATYCYNTLEKYSDNAELRTLLVDLLNYGAASQIYSGRNVNSLANAKLTSEQKSWASDTIGELSSVKNTKYETISDPKVIWKSAGLKLKDKVEFRMKFISETSNALSVKIKSESGREWILGTEDIVSITDEFENGYMFDFDGADATMMSETFYFTIYSGDTAISDTLSYSVESYISRKITTSDTVFASLLECIIKYGNSAKKYVNQ